jgi:hypothetical protein
MKYKFIIVGILLLNMVAPLFGATPLAVKNVSPKDKICFAMYTVQNKVLKMSVQFYPLAKGESRKAELQIKTNGQWKTVDTKMVREDFYYPKSFRKKFKNRDWAFAQAWNLLFRVDGWDDSKDYKYRVVALDGIAKYGGIIRKNPIDKEEIVVAAFTGNSNRDRSMRSDIIKNIKYQDPDLLFFSGDQSYDHRQHLAAWLLFGEQFGEIIRNRPTVAIPDDHDVGQPNLWGENGKVSTFPAASDGGYQLPAQYVKEVEFAQTSNLPDAFDPTKIEQGIGVYYTSLNVGGVDFAIIEDRKFKSGPHGKIPQMGPRPDHITLKKYDFKAIDVKGLKLLGDRQLSFLGQWTQDWKNAEMKCVLSATILANAAHCHGGRKNRVVADMDSNGWPQTPRNNALKAIRKGFAFMLAGDQHLATVTHMGVDEFDDSGWAFSVPSIINYYGRWWLPEEAPKKRVDSPLKFTGSYFDGFHNHLTMQAYANPGENNGISPMKNYVRMAAGYGLVRFDKNGRTIEMECWPRGVDVSKKNAKQYKGWPVKITQADNYGREAVAYLPEIVVTGMENPVVKVINEKTKEVIYTIRIKGTHFQPKVFDASVTYLVIVGDQEKTEKTLKNLKPTQDIELAKVLKVSF